MDDLAHLSLGCGTCSDAMSGASLACTGRSGRRSTASLPPGTSRPGTPPARALSAATHSEIRSPRPPGWWLPDPADRLPPRASIAPAAACRTLPHA